MRDVKRIGPILDKIRNIWEKNPDLRLMQLLGNVLPAGDNYYVEDTVLERSLDTGYKRSGPFAGLPYSSGYKPGKEK